VGLAIWADALPIAALLSDLAGSLDDPAREVCSVLRSKSEQRTYALSQREFWFVSLDEPDPVLLFICCRVCLWAWCIPAAQPAPAPSFP
jgi:hypothetical protein